MKTFFYEPVGGPFKPLGAPPGGGGVGTLSFSLVSFHYNAALGVVNHTYRTSHVTHSTFWPPVEQEFNESPVINLPFRSINIYWYVVLNDGLGSPLRSTNSVPVSLVALNPIIMPPMRPAPKQICWLVMNETNSRLLVTMPFWAAANANRIWIPKILWIWYPNCCRSSSTVIFICRMFSWNTRRPI